MQRTVHLQSTPVDRARAFLLLLQQFICSQTKLFFFDINFCCSRCKRRFTGSSTRAAKCLFGWVSHCSTSDGSNVPNCSIDEKLDESVFQSVHAKRNADLLIVYSFKFGTAKICAYEFCCTPCRFGVIINCGPPSAELYFVSFLCYEHFYHSSLPAWGICMWRFFNDCWPDLTSQSFCYRNSALVIFRTDFNVSSLPTFFVLYS